MQFRKMSRVAAAAAALLLLTPLPAIAQEGAGISSPSYDFLKAVKDADIGKVNQLINSGPTMVNTRDLSTGETALHIVTRRRDTPWMRYLLERGADPNQRDKDGMTALIIAADQRFVDGARLLIAGRANVNVANRNGETPLIRAVQLRDQSMVRVLIDNGANPDLTDSLAGYSARDYAERDTRAGTIQQILRDAGKPGATPPPAPPAAAPPPPKP